MRAELQPMPATPNASWRYHIRRSDRFDFSWGFHEEVELVLIVEGDGRRLVGDSSEPYGPGDLTLIGAGLPHTYASSPGVDRNAAVIVQFLGPRLCRGSTARFVGPGPAKFLGPKAPARGTRDTKFAPDFLGDGLWRCPEFAGIADLLRAARRGLTFDRPPEPVVEELPRLGDQPPARRTLALLAILQTLAEAGDGRALAGATYVPDLGETTRRRVDEVCSYVLSAYHRPVTLDDVAGLVHLSRAAFSRFFHRTMGRTFTEYLNEVRIDAACRLLVETDLPVTAVAARCGYRNLSYFNRRFLRRKGTQPQRYRRQFRPG